MENTNYRPLAETLSILSRPIPREYCVTKPRREKTFPGICRFIVALSWEGTVRDMNDRLPFWSFTLPYQPVVVGSYVSITARVSIPTSDQGVIVREMSGAVQLKDGDLAEGYGDPVTTAAHKAVRKALAYFGYGLEFELPEIWMELKPNGKIPKYDERMAVDKWKYYSKDGRPVKHAQNTPERPQSSTRGNTQADRGTTQDAPKALNLGDLKKAYYDVGITIGDDRDRLGPVFHGIYAKPASLESVLSTNRLTEDDERVIKILRAVREQFTPEEYGSAEAIHRSARAFIQRTINDGYDLKSPAKIKQAITEYKTPA